MRKQPVSIVAVFTDEERATKTCTNLNLLFIDDLTKSGLIRAYYHPPGKNSKLWTSNENFLTQKPNNSVRLRNPKYTQYFILLASKLQLIRTNL